MYLKHNDQGLTNSHICSDVSVCSYTQRDVSLVHKLEIDIETSDLQTVCVCLQLSDTYFPYREFRFTPRDAIYSEFEEEVLQFIAESTLNDERTNR